MEKTMEQLIEDLRDAANFTLIDEQRALLVEAADGIEHLLLKLHLIAHERDLWRGAVDAAAAAAMVNSGKRRWRKRGLFR
jgi:hypothetical protein